MATIRSYTTIEQSKTLSKILSHESADMCFNIANMIPLMVPYGRFDEFFDISPTPDFLIPCWSLSALLDILPNSTDIIKEEADTENERYMCAVGINDDIIPTFSNNPVDACVNMITKLHELKLM